MKLLPALIAADAAVTAAVCCGTLPFGAMFVAWSCGIAASLVRRENRDNEAEARIAHRRGVMRGIERT